MSQAAHEQRDRCDERTTGAGALWCVLGAPGPAESTTCHVRIMPICVWYVGVAWSTRSAMAHHDSEVMRSFCPWHAPARPRFQEPAPILKPSRIERKSCPRPALDCLRSPSRSSLHVVAPSQLHSRRKQQLAPWSAKAAAPRLSPACPPASRRIGRHPTSLDRRPVEGWAAPWQLSAAQKPPHRGEASNEKQRPIPLSSASLN